MTEIVEETIEVKDTVKVSQISSEGTLTGKVVGSWIDSMGEVFFIIDLNKEECGYLVSKNTRKRSDARFISRIIAHRLSVKKEKTQTNE